MMLYNWRYIRVTAYLRPSKSNVLHKYVAYAVLYSVINCYADAYAIDRQQRTLCITWHELTTQNVKSTSAR